MSLAYSTRTYYNIAPIITAFEMLKYDRSKTAAAVSSYPRSMYVVCADAVIEGGV
jgi:hypothetical protein